MRAYWVRSTPARELVLTGSSGCSYQTGRWVPSGRVLSVVSSLILYHPLLRHLRTSTSSVESQTFVASLIQDTELCFFLSPPCLYYAHGCQRSEWLNIHFLSYVEHYRDCSAERVTELIAPSGWQFNRHSASTFVRFSRPSLLRKPGRLICVEC
jgi:hypothetical protein